MPPVMWPTIILLPPFTGGLHCGAWLFLVVAAYQALLPPFSVVFARRLPDGPDGSRT